MLYWDVGGEKGEEKMGNLKVIANEMLPVYENDEGLKLVDARKLHEQLLVGRDFTNWIKDRINKYGFVEGEDFTTFLAKSTGGRPSTEYYLVLDTGKEIAMVENNEQGRAIRKYFIEVEKKHRNSKPQSQLEILQGAINQMVEQENRINIISNEQETIKHRLDNIDKVDTIGDLQQRLNAMVRRYAQQEGVNFGTAWRDFRTSFNTAYRTNLKARMNYYKTKHGLKQLTMPQFLSLTETLEDGVRVADKMLNKELV